MRPAVLLVAALAVNACESTPPTPPLRRRDADVRPRFPGEVGIRNVQLACFPHGFSTTRVRVAGGAVELCGVIPSGRARCFRVDPFTSEVTPAVVPDAPTQAVPEPVMGAPFTRGELLVRGGRATLRGGTFTSLGAGGARVATAQQLGFHSLDNAVLVPWSEGWFVAVVGVRAPDLGASAIVDPATTRAVGRAAVLPCDGGV